MLGGELVPQHLPAADRQPRVLSRRVEALREGQAGEEQRVANPHDGRQQQEEAGLDRDTGEEAQWSAEATAQRRSGEVADGPLDCQVVRVAIGVTIVKRKGGRTEVKPSDAQPMESGWTDAYLPQKAPAAVTSAVRQRGEPARPQ